MSEKLLILSALCIILAIIIRLYVYVARAEFYLFEKDIYRLNRKKRDLNGWIRVTERKFNSR